MRKRTRIHLPIGLALVLAMALAVTPSSAHHTATHDQNPNPPAALGPTTVLHFEGGSLVIPMDACFQRPSFIADAELVAITGSALKAAACNTNTQKDDGMIPAYSLMFRLVQAGIPVSWSLRSGKTDWNDVDFSIVKAGFGPVTWRAPGHAENATRYSSQTTIQYRGAPFVIDAAYAAEAITLMNTLGNIHPEYKDVDYHIAQVGFDAPIYKTLTQLPKLAILDLSDLATFLPNQKTVFLAEAIGDAVLADATNEPTNTKLRGNMWSWVTIPSVNSGGLSGYNIAWVASFDLFATATTAQTTFLNSLAGFANGGGSIVFQDGAVGSIEGYGTMSGLSYTASRPSLQSFQADGGLIVNGVSSTWDNGSATETTRATDYSDPASQFGGSIWTGIGGSKYSWKPRYDKAYLPGVRRMIYSWHATDDTKNRWDFAIWRKKDNDSAKGTIYYLGGDHWRRVTASGFRVLMNTLLASAPVQVTSTAEIARSSPIIATVGGIETDYQGTLEVTLPAQPVTTYSTATTSSTFRFPATKGHLRAIDIAQLADGANSFTASTNAILFDAANGIPTPNATGSGCAFPATGTCRRIFTDTGSPTAPAETMVVTGNHTILRPLLGVATDADADELIQRISAGRKSGTSWVAALGGIDRSTPAVIEPSPLIPNGRATMIYVGATDGMLHAICAETGPGCPAAGRELWAFLPSSELGKVRNNNTRLDGSPKVVDIFGSFNGAARTLKTVLVFQTGNRLPSATYAIDITDPRSPNVLWKVTTDGPGVGVAMGWVRDGAAITPMTWVQSAYNPAGDTAGFQVRAIDTASGVVRWTKNYDYPAALSVTNEPPPLSAMPGGVTVVADLGGTTADSLLVPSLYGRVWKLDPLTGDNVYGTDEMFTFGEDFHPIGAPIALYRSPIDGVLRAVVVSGGYADPFEPSATQWAPDDVHQYAVSFPVVPSTVPLTRADIASDDSLGIHVDFGEGQRAFSPAVVAGGEIFFTTDVMNVNAADYGTVQETGRLWRKSLSSDAAATAVVIPSGAAAPDVSISTGTVLTGGISGVEKTRPSGFDAVGSSTEVAPSTSSSRRLWLRLR